ncbi:MAG: ATP-binding cassette domain-containing protein [Muribaculaceae bacterium]|nr:ATP-binding cassette domain-containing protein [Muribaculaceae bacterium]
MKQLLSLESTRLFYSTVSIDNPFSISIPGGIVAVVGPNGSGKSLLGNIITRGRNFRTNRIITPPDFKVKKVEFDDIHSLRGITAPGYYQQRYEATMNEDVPTIRDVIPANIDRGQFLNYCKKLGMADITERKINFLSSGELRKLLIALTLSERPDLLILDNPYIGLDHAARVLLDEALQQLRTDGVNIMLLLCDPLEIPQCTDAVVPVNEMTVHDPIVVENNLRPIQESLLPMFDFSFNKQAIPARPTDLSAQYNTIVKFDNCKIANGHRLLIESFDWTIKDNERWSLSGPNGSGKSTILSLINADNPAGYRSNIILFDRQRGSGESIWDIKRLIGYVSPEMKLYFTGTGDLESIVGHGLVDTVGNFVKLSEKQIAHAYAWIKVMNMENLTTTPYSALSAGERQLALVTRAIIKQPRLLILDEPMHALDYGRKKALRELLEHMCHRSDNAPEANPMSMIFVTHQPQELPDTVMKTKSL